MPPKMIGKLYKEVEGLRNAPVTLNGHLADV